MVKKKVKGKKQVSKKKPKEKKKLSNVAFTVFIIIAILLVLLFFLIISEFMSKDSSDSPKKFNIRDECSLVLGNLIHPIKDSGSCRIRCINECRTQGFQFKDFEFTLNSSSCNTCECSCE